MAEICMAALIRFFAVVASLALMAVVAMVPLDWKGQLELGGVFVAIAFVLPRLSSHRRITLVLIILSIFSSTRYAYWRVSETVLALRTSPGDVYWLDLVFIFMLLAAEAYAFVILILGYFQTLRPLKRPPMPLPPDLELWPTVDVYIPTYNEPLTVVRPTVLASLSLDWPPEKIKVYILDDGRRPEFREFAEQCGCEYLIRPNNHHAKAGNINHALTQTHGDYISIFDCDHIPTRSFLQVAMGWFLQDPRLGVLQTPHHFYSPDPFERNLRTFREIPNEGALFYGVVQDGSDFWNAAFFCGSCAVLQRTALEEIGGVAVETVTEDAHTSLRMQKCGWNTAYINVPQAAGLATGSLVAHIGQRIRWARGMVQILRTENPLFAKGLRWPQRLCYFNSVVHFLYPIPRLIFLTAPLVYILLGRTNLLGYVLDIAAYAFPHLFLATMTNSRIQGRHRHSFWNEVYETILAPYILLPTTVALFFPKLGKFNVTSKGDVFDSAFFDWHIARPYLALLALNFAGVCVAIYKLVNHSAPVETIAVNLLWLVFNSVILGASIAVAGETRQARATVRIEVQIPFVLALQTGDALAAETQDISMGGARLRVGKVSNLQVGDKLKLEFFTAAQRVEFPAIVRQSLGDVICVQFEHLDLETEKHLVRIIYGRADTWLSWRRGHENDRPMRSLAAILRHAAGGMGVMLRATLPQKTKAARALAKAASLILVIGGALSLSTHLGARPLAGTAANAAFIAGPSRTFNETHDLASLGEKQHLMLRGAEAGSSVFFQIPLTKVVDHVSLDLQYRASPNVTPRTSKLEILLNGNSIASVPVIPNPDSPESLITVPIELSAVHLTSDNVIRFQFQGQCSFDCEEDGAANYWTRIELSTRLHVSGSILSLANALWLLPAPFFDSSQQRAVQVPFVFGGSPGTQELEAAGIAASWFGLVADYRGIHFPVSLGAIPQGNVILVATRDSPLVASFGLSRMSGPALAIRTNPVDEYGKVLVITGDSGAQLLTAARALAEQNFPKTGDLASLDETGPPPARDLYDAPRWLSTSRRAGLGDFSSSEQLKIYGNGGIDLYFRFPPDLYFGERRALPLRIRYRCTGISSTLKGQIAIRLNGRLIALKPVDLQSVNQVATQGVLLPVESLALNNTVNVEFSFGNLSALTGGRRRYPEVTVLKSSDVDISSIPHFVEMPKLELFANTGFPYTRSADLAQTTVIVPDHPTQATLENVLDLLGFFGARTGYPGLRVTVAHPTQAPALKDKDLLVVGNSTEEILQEPWLAGIPFRMAQGQVTLAPPANWLDRLSLFPGSTFSHDRSSLEDWAARGTPDLLLEQFPTPQNSHRIVTFVAGNAAQEQAALQLITTGDSAVSKLFGEVSLYQDGAFRSFLLEPSRARLGHLPPHERFNFWASRYFVGIPIILTVLALLVAGIIDTLLERRAKERLTVASS
jgi:cellulose synthase (UDP-forming)